MTCDQHYSCKLRSGSSTLFHKGFSMLLRSPVGLFLPSLKQAPARLSRRWSATDSVVMQVCEESPAATGYSLRFGLLFYYFNPIIFCLDHSILVSHHVGSHQASCLDKDFLPWYSHLWASIGILVNPYMSKKHWPIIDCVHWLLIEFPFFTLWYLFCLDFCRGRSKQLLGGTQNLITLL